MYKRQEYHLSSSSSSFIFVVFKTSKTVETSSDDDDDVLNAYVSRKYASSVFKLILKSDEKERRRNKKLYSLFFPPVCLFGGRTTPRRIVMKLDKGFGNLITSTKSLFRRGNTMHAIRSRALTMSSGRSSGGFGDRRSFLAEDDDARRVVSSSFTSSSSSGFATTISSPLISSTERRKRRGGGGGERGGHKNRHRRRSKSQVVLIQNAGAFTKLIEIPQARAVARGVLLPARYFVDGKRRKESVLVNEMVRVPNEDQNVPLKVAKLIPLSGYDVGEVPFVMQVVSYYRNPLDCGMMKRALEKALEKYPMLAGRLDLQTPGFRNKGVRLTNSGVPFRVVNEPFEDGGARTIDDLPQDFASESRRFLDFAPWIDLMLGDAPAFTVKITNLPNNGGSVSVSYTHLTLPTIYAV